MNRKLFNDLEKLVIEASKKKENKFGFGIWSHHIASVVELGEKILQNYHYPAEKIIQVKSCIMSHRGSLDIERSTLEEVCVSDADAASHIIQVPSLLYLAYKEKGLTIDEGKDFVLKKITRSWNKLSPNSKRVFEKEYQSAVNILL